tara:strand:+ start:2200 stop:3738 length:1539 start_codon:yes stop_codon:yes gene_type:complete
MSDAKKFAAIFDGLKLAYGTYKIDRTKTNGKQAGKASVLKEPRTLSHWEGHLSGKGDSIGIIPINEDNSCKWGCIDVDQYPLDHKAIIEKIRRMKLPLVVCRSKSGGAHLFLFTTEWISAKEMQEVLQHIAAALGYGDCEIFPKQVKLFLDRGDVGNFLNLPYYDAEEGLRYAVKEDGQSATLEEFFALHGQYVQTLEQIQALTIEDDPETPVKDGPPCLQTLCKQQISEGGRNNGLFNIGVYLRKAYPDSWESEILTYNAKYLVPPLPLTEVNLVAKQLQKKDYAYKCKDAPINAYCNSDVCRTRKFGIEVGLAGTEIANLRKYNSSPPIWFLDVNGTPLELDTEGLMLQGAFQRACVEQLNFMPRTMSKPTWEARINQLLTDMSETDGSIVEVSQDASIQGQFYEFLEEFCTAMQKAESREEILLRRPWTDEEESLIYFRLKDFEAYLRKNKFFEYKSHKIAQRLRDINGTATSLKIKGKATRVWSIPSYETHVGSIATPTMGALEEAPF